MNHMRLLPILMLSFGTALSSCGTDNGGNPDGGMGGDMGGGGCSVEATFDSLHDDLFANEAGTCTNLACHNDNTEMDNGGLNFSQGADAVFTELTMEGTGSAVASSMFPNRVAAGDSSASYLFHKVSEAMPVDGSRMPVGPALQQCEIDAIMTWINNGAAR